MLVRVRGQCAGGREGAETVQLVWGERQCAKCTILCLSFSHAVVVSGRDGRADSVVYCAGSHEEEVSTGLLRTQRE